MKRLIIMVSIILSALALTNLVGADVYDDFEDGVIGFYDTGTDNWTNWAYTQSSGEQFVIGDTISPNTEVDGIFNLNGEVTISSCEATKSCYKSIIKNKYSIQNQTFNFTDRMYINFTANITSANDGDSYAHSGAKEISTTYFIHDREDITNKVILFQRNTTGEGIGSVLQHVLFNWTNSTPDVLNLQIENISVNDSILTVSEYYNTNISSLNNDGFWELGFTTKGFATKSSLGTHKFSSTKLYITEVDYLYNYLPQLAVTISPTPATPVQDLTCSYTFDDYDADIENRTWINWYKGGVSQGVNATVLDSGNTTDNDQWKCGVVSFDGLENSSEFFSNTVTIGDDVAPNITDIGKALSTSYTSDQQANLTIDCVDGGSLIDTAVVQMNTPAGIINESLISFTGDTFGKLLSLTTGSYEIQEAWCLDQSGNSVKNSTSFNFTVTTPAVTVISGGGGGGGARGELLIDYGQPFLSFTPFTIPSRPCQKLLLRNIGNNSLSGATVIIGDNLTGIITWDFSDSKTSMLSQTLTLDVGESSILTVCADVREDFEFIEDTFTIRGSQADNELLIKLERVPGYKLVDIFSRITGVTGVPALATTYVLTMLSLYVFAVFTFGLVGGF